MSEAILYVDTSQVREGKLADVRHAMQELAEFVRTHEPQLVAYGFYLSCNETRMSVVAVHPDAASMDFHLNVAGPAFRRFVGLIDLRHIDIYGRISESALKQLQEKAELLGHATVTVHEPCAGFARFADHATQIG